MLWLNLDSEIARCNVGIWRIGQLWAFHSNLNHFEGLLTFQWDKLLYSYDQLLFFLTALQIPTHTRGTTHSSSKTLGQLVIRSNQSTPIEKATHQISFVPTLWEVAAWQDAECLNAVDSSLSTRTETVQIALNCTRHDSSTGFATFICALLPIT